MGIYQKFEVCFTKNDNDYCFISNTPDLNTKGAGDYIFPDSASRNLKEADLAGLDKEISKSSGSGSQKSASGYTNVELCKMAQDYYERHYNYRLPIAEVDSTEGDNVTIHLYVDMGDHTATSAWYVIDRKTGRGYDDLFGDKIDLTK